MKKKFSYIAIVCLLISMSCEQEPIAVVPPEEPTPDTSCATATAGTLDLTKFIAIGNSFVAGMQGGALYTDGQNNSLAAIINKQFECAGGTATFNQPTIGATLGWNLFVTQPFLTNGTSPILGRMLLQYGTSVSCVTGLPSPKPTPQAYGAGNLEALPNPTFNPGFLYTAGSKLDLNNFAVPAITLGQALTTATGDWTNPNPAVGFSPFYARFGTVPPGPGASTIIGDAAAAGGSFFLFWLGLDDFFLHAAFGADPNYAPLTSAGLFSAYYNAALSPTTGLLASNPNLNGVVGNFPDIFKMPHFTAVAYNPIPLDQVTVDLLTPGFAGYNSALDALIANKVALGISDNLAAEIDTRRVSFTVGCTNKILLIDETLTGLGPYFDNLGLTGPQRAALVPYEQVRQTTPADIIPLAAGSILGTNGTFGVLGVSEPVGDRYVIIPTERDAINAARDAFNTTVSDYVTANSTRLALADVSAAMATLVTNQAGNYNGVWITPKIDPPTGIYSEDGAHFNTRGYAFISRTFISAINAKYGSKIPLTNIGSYSATALPIP